MLFFQIGVHYKNNEINNIEKFHSSGKFDVLNGLCLGSHYDRYQMIEFIQKKL